MGITGRVTSAVAASLLSTMIGASAFGQVQTTDQQKCINTLNKDTSKVAATQGKENAACVKNGTKGTATANCLTADSKQKVAKATAKTSQDETKNACLTTSLPSFGYSGATIGNQASQVAEIDLFRDTYGTSDPTTVISTAAAEGRCQSAVTKDLEKLVAAKRKQYVACKKKALKIGASNASALEACIGVPAPGTPDPNSIQADPKGKIGGSVTKLSSDTSANCAPPVVIATTFPGACSGSTAGALAACLDARAECRACLAINATDNLNVNCDLFDDGAPNGSCLPLAAQSACVLLGSNPPSGSPSRMTLYSELLSPIVFSLIGSLSIGAEGPFATCKVQSLNPVNLAGMGFLCLSSGGSCPVGRRYCGSGAGTGPALGLDTQSDGYVGTCTSNTQCASLCTASCGGSSVTAAACTGYCSGTSPANQACTSDAACLPSNGICNGPTPAPPFGICQCSCTESSAGAPSDPGDLQCNLGLKIVLEMAAPCDGADIVRSAGNVCIPLSTEQATGAIVHSNLNSCSQCVAGWCDGIIPCTSNSDCPTTCMVPTSPLVNDQTGTPVSCAALDAGNPSGWAGVGAASLFGRFAGDMSVALKATCQ